MTLIPLPDNTFVIAHHCAQVSAGSLDPTQIAYVVELLRSPRENFVLMLNDRDSTVPFPGPLTEVTMRDGTRFIVPLTLSDWSAHLDARIKEG